MSGLLTGTERLNYIEAYIEVDQKPIELEGWQQAHVQDVNKYSIVLKSRRTGFSFDVALKGIVKANDPARIKFTRQFVSYNEEDAKEKITFAKEFYHSIPKKYKKPLVSETKTTMEFLDKGGKTTSRLISIACRPPRGRGGDIVFDEMAIYPKNKARVIYTAGLPVIARGGCVEIGSTPFGKMGMFYDIFTNRGKYKVFARYTVPWWLISKLCNNVTEAARIAPKMETEERVKRFGTNTLITSLSAMFFEDFQQEYECSFIDSALSFISLDLIYANTPGMRITDRATELIDDESGEGVDGSGMEIKVFKDADSLLIGYDPQTHGEILYAGYDVARRRDAAVIFVIGIMPDGKKRAVAEIEMVNQTFDYQLSQFRKIMRLPVLRAAIDQTGQGEPLVEWLQKEFGQSKIEGVIFTSESKEEMAIRIRTTLEQNNYLLHNDNRFHRQIHSIKRMPTSGGHFRYDSERDGTGHSDSFWAWALADYAVLRKGTAFVKPGFYSQRKARLEGVASTADKRVMTKTRGKSYSSLIRNMEGG